MNKIKCKADAEELIRRLAAGDAVISLWDTPASIRVITRIVDDGSSGFYVSYHEDTTGEDWRQFHYLSEIIDTIWNNRKHINNSDQLQHI